MFKRLNTSLFTAIVAGLCLYSSNSYSYRFEITDFRFGMNNPSFSDWNAGGTSPTPIDPDQYGILEEGTYQGTNATNVLVNFTFFSGEVHVYTRDENQGSPNSAAGSIPGGPTPSIDLVNLTADLSSWFAEWNGTEFNQGNNTNFSACASNAQYASLSSVATVTDHYDKTYTVNWNSCISGGAFNSQIGFWRLELDCLNCPDIELGPSDSLVATQAAQTTRTVLTTGGNVVITSSFGASPAGYTYTWTSLSDAGITDIDANEGSFTFDPSGLTPGLYVFQTVYVDSNPFPVEKSSGRIVLRVVDSVSGDTADTDNDGITNDNDDSGLAATQLQSVLANSASHVLQSDKGTLVLGQTAFCANKAARIDMDDIANFGSSICTSPDNADDSLIKAVGVGGFFDFEVHGLTPGDTAQIVLPLNAPIPAHATYRKYSQSNGWTIFDTSEGDQLASAESTSDGICPSPDSTSYTSGLTQGHTCVRLTITDGSRNDADGGANGIIKDPGGVAEIQSGVKPSLSGCSISGRPTRFGDHAEWLILATFITWLGIISRRTRKH